MGVVELEYARLELRPVAPERRIDRAYKSEGLARSGDRYRSFANGLVCKAEVRSVLEQ